jgi:hypothetical protein
MKPNIDNTWWKRLFTVVEIGIAAVIGLVVFYRFVTKPQFSDSDLLPLIIGAVFVGLIHLLRVGVCYIVEGPGENLSLKKPTVRKTPAPQSPPDEPPVYKL